MGLQSSASFLPSNCIKINLFNIMIIKKNMQENSALIKNTFKLYFSHEILHETDKKIRKVFKSIQYKVFLYLPLVSTIIMLANQEVHIYLFSVNGKMDLHENNYSF